MKWLNCVIIIVLCALVANCGGIRGSGGTVEGPTTETTKANKILKGKVTKVDTALHEIIVNGETVYLKGAQIIRNTEVKSESDLYVGQIVSVETSKANKKGDYSALTILIEDQLQGPIESINLEARTIKVLGQEIHVPSATSFTTKSFKLLRPSYFVAVFGYRNGQGVLEASLIEIIREEFIVQRDSVKISGKVDDVYEGSGVIVVEGVEINVGIDKSQHVQVGDMITLNGLQINSSVSKSLIAKEGEVSIQKEIKFYDANLEIILEGIPMNITENKFTLNGYQVLVSEDLMSAEEAQKLGNRKLVVKGVFVSGSEILALEVFAEKIKDFEYRGRITPNGTADSFEVFGITIYTNKYTTINFSLAELLKIAAEKVNGATVYAKGFVDSQGRRIATTVSYNAEEDEQYEFVKGRIDSITEESVVVADTTIRLNNFVIYLNESRNLNTKEVFKLIAVGDQVEFFGGFATDAKFLAYFLRKVTNTDSAVDKIKSIPILKGIRD